MNQRFIRVQHPHGWQILDTGCDPARPIALVFEDHDPTIIGCGIPSANVQHVLELLNRDHEMRVAVNGATNRGPAA